MSKLTKLILNPKMFFQDAIGHRRRIQDAQLQAVEPKPAAKSAARPKPQPKRSASGPIPTYVFGFNTWKVYLREWFPDRTLHFLPMKIKAAEFDKQWRDKIRADSRSEIFIWGFKVERYVTRFAQEHGIKCSYVEDGFIRSIGLGATRTQPFSLTFDTRTPYFDATKASDLERLLNTYDFDGDPQLLARADRLMQVLLQSGLSKYNHAKPIDIHAIYGPKTRKRILVIGQVEDDASIQYGCAKGYSNNDAVMIAALEHPDAQIIYKPHPDVLNKHRELRSNPDDVRHLCLVLEQDVPLAQSFETIDHVYTITSQAGFEALMRRIAVTTLGCPFYAGWGLTDDRQANKRRARKLSLREVFAAAYLLYPRYFDPIYKTPLSAEQAVERLVDLRRLARPAPAGAVRCEPASPAPTAAVAPGEVASPGPVADTQGLRDEVATLRLEVEDLRLQLKQGAMHHAVTALCNDLRALGAEIVQLRNKVGPYLGTMNPTVVTLAESNEPTRVIRRCRGPRALR